MMLAKAARLGAAVAVTHTRHSNRGGTPGRPVAAARMSAGGHGAMRATRLANHRAFGGHGFAATRGCVGGRRGCVMVRAGQDERPNQQGEDLVVERSNVVYEELMLFFFRGDLETRLQRCLNLEQAEQAEMLRAKIEEVQAAIASHAAKKRGAAQAMAQAASDTSATDRAALGLQLKSDLARAIEEERYQDAAALRDRLAEVESQLLSAAASAAVASSQKRAIGFRLGQRVQHKTAKWQGLVCGFDPACTMDEQWIAAATAYAPFTEGTNQPFYQVLVDDSLTPGQFEVAYVPQERLVSFEDLAVEGELKAIEHPFTYLLFFGMDAKGNYIPSRVLRNKFDAERFIDPDLMVDDDSSQGGGEDGPIVL